MRVHIVSARYFLSALAIAILSLVANQALAAKGGGGAWSMGFNIGIVNAEQKDMNSIIEATDEASKFGNSWEGSVQLAYRFTDTSLIFRPTYIFNTEKGGGSEYSLNGFTFFPIMRFHLLEDQTIKFYSNLGVGFGWVTGKISEAGTVTEFSGNDFGYLGGLGAEFCFWGDHCINVEGNVRFLNVDRTKVTEASGTDNNSRITQRTKGREFEISDRDFSVSLTGVQGFVGYTMYF